MKFLVELKVYQFEVLCAGRFVFYQLDVRSRVKAEIIRIHLKNRYEDEFGEPAEVNILEWDALVSA